MNKIELNNKKEKIIKKINILNEVYFRHDKKLILINEPYNTFTLHLLDGTLLLNDAKINDVELVVRVLYNSWLYKMIEY